MQDFIEPDSSDEQLNEAALLDPGEYLLVLKSIDIGTATDKNTGVEYGYWVFSAGGGDSQPVVQGNADSSVDRFRCGHEEPATL